MHKTFKIFTAILVLSGLLFFTNNSFAQNLQKKTVQFTREHAIYSYNYNSGSIILIHPRKGGFISEFTTKGTSAKYLSNLKNNCVAINGFYFGRGVNGESYQPAWPVTRYIGWDSDPIIIPSDTDPANDVNLGVQIFYNSTTNAVSLGSPISINHGVSFFAGPMILTDGVTNSALSQKISHRSSAHYRTFLIQDTNNKAIRWLTTEKISLPDLATSLSTIMKGKKINVVNLDGGSSTAFSSDRLSYNASKALPSFFHSCK